MVSPADCYHVLYNFFIGLLIEFKWGKMQDFTYDGVTYFGDLRRAALHHNIYFLEPVPRGACDFVDVSSGVTFFIVFEDITP